MALARFIAKLVAYLLGFFFSFAIAAALVYFLQPLLGVNVSMALGVVLFACAFYGVYTLAWRPAGVVSGKALLFLVPAVPLVYGFGLAPFVTLEHEQVVPIESVTALEKQVLSLSKGEEMAVYTAEVVDRLPGVAPVVFVNGGPGGPITPKTADFLAMMGQSGFEVYTFDHYSSGGSQYKTFDKNLLNAESEVRRLNEMLDQLRGEAQVHLIGSSYAGSLISRYILQYGDKVASYVAMDTAPLHSMYTGNMKDRMAYDRDDADALLATLEAAEGTDPSVMLGAVLKDADSLPKKLKALLTLVWGAPNGEYTFGGPEEGSQITKNLLSTGEHQADPRMGLFRLSMAAQIINTDMSLSDDFSEALRALDTPPVLVVFPEESVFDWLFFKDYKNFFDSVAYLPWPEAGHGVWETRPEALIENLTSFFSTGTIASPYLGEESPFE